MDNKVKSRITFHDLHHTRSFKKKFIEALSDPVASIVICSPFFDRLPTPFNDIVGFCVFMKRRGTEKIQIITRPPGADNTAITLETAKTLAAQDVEIFIRSSPYLHAKMYHFEYERGYFRSFVGSANFTLGGFERNHEIVAEMQGVGNSSPCHREIERMQGTNGALTFNAWVAHGRPIGVGEVV